MKLIEYAMELNKINTPQSKITMQNLDWTHIEFSDLEKLPKLSFILGSDVFFSGKRKFFYFTSLKISFVKIKIV